MIFKTTVWPQVSGWSNLILSFTSPADSGNYSCQPSNARPDTVQVNIIKGQQSTVTSLDFPASQHIWYLSLTEREVTLSLKLRGDGRGPLPERPCWRLVLVLVDHFLFGFLLFYPSDELWTNSQVL